MKHLLLTFALLTAALIPQARAIDSLPYLGSLRTEVFNQLTIASNNVATSTNVIANKKLIITLKGALRGIDRTKPSNYVAGAQISGLAGKRAASVSSQSVELET